MPRKQSGPQGVVLVERGNPDHVYDSTRDAPLAVVKVVSDREEGWSYVNVADFDPDEHELFIQPTGVKKAPG